MKSNLMKAAFVAAIAMMASINVFNAQKTEGLSDVALANVEALANSEYDPVKGWPCKLFVWDNVMDEDFFITIRCSDCFTVSATSVSGDGYCRHSL